VQELKADFNFLGPERLSSNGELVHSGIYWSRGIEHASVGQGSLRLLNPKGMFEDSDAAGMHQRQSCPHYIDSSHGKKVKVSSVI
jgi:hypothetical protein